MDEYRWNNYHVPAFGSWDYGNDGLEYTQCFENARQGQGGATIGSLVRYGSYNSQVEDRDLYVAGDLYQNHLVTPAVIVVPRRRVKKGGSTNEKAEKKQENDMQKQEWNGYSYDIKEPPSPLFSPPKQTHYKSKPVDQDLYQVPPEYCHVKPRRKRRFGLFSSCLLADCV